jgi:murein DD-endopeptidase MepM/ murein hydrolase activator NlpD
VFERLDVRDTPALERVLAEHQVAAVVHFAAYKAVGESTARPLDYYDNNVGGLLSLCKAMRRQGCRRLVFSSSATVYGEPQSLPIREDAPLSAVNPYGETKLVGENLVRAVTAAEPSFHAAILRYFNPVGADESGLIGEDPLGTPNNLMPYVAQVASGRRPRLQVFGADYPTPDGTGVRDYIHVVDLAEGHVAALQFLLERAGHGPGRADGAFGPLTHAAVLRAQGAAGLTADGLAGPATISALSGGSQSTPTSTAPRGRVCCRRPVRAPDGDGFGAPRNGYLHEGLDFPVPYGTRVGAAGVGTTIFAGYNNGGFGNLVVIQHRLGYATWYAHLSSITTWVGEQVSGGTRIGYVGSTGYSTGPHLHFEVRRYDTAVDPMPLLLPGVALRSGTGKGHSEPLECADGGAERRKLGPKADWIAREPLC